MMLSFSFYHVLQRCVTVCSTKVVFTSLFSRLVNFLPDERAERVPCADSGAILAHNLKVRSQLWLGFL